jgi:cytochrome c biogenesis protein CcmG/thiol:disulfide interchange protein DsbE
VPDQPGLVPSRRFLLPALLVAALVAAPASGAPASGTPAPSFTLPTRAGSVCLDSLRGKVVLVDFWASWCGPCQKSFPWMADVYGRYAGKGLAIVAINLDKGRDPAEDFLRDHPAPFTVAFDPKGAVAKAYKVWGMPTSFLIDSSGKIVLTHSGFDPKRTAEVEAAIQKECSP